MRGPITQGVLRFGIWIVIGLNAILIPISAQSANPDLLAEPPLQPWLQQAIDRIYGFEFASARQQLDQMPSTSTNHPVYPLLEMLYIYWAHFPMVENNAAYDTLLEQAETVIERSEKMAMTSAHSAEAGFYAVIANAFLADLYHDHGKLMRAIGSAKRCYDGLKHRLAPDDRMPEYYFPAGLYHYYRVMKPIESPYIQPFIWLFPEGDRERGLDYLKRGSRKAVFTKNECDYYLFHFYLHYENDPLQSYKFINTLIQTYPDNQKFAAAYAENLYRLARFDQLGPPIRTLLNSPHSRIQSLGHLFLGMVNQHAKQDPITAEQHYSAAEALWNTESGIEMSWFLSYLFIERGRIALSKNDRKLGRHYYRQALQNAKYRSITQMVHDAFISLELDPEATGEVQTDG
jgi:hypothetical protein